MPFSTEHTPPPDQPPGWVKEIVKASAIQAAQRANGPQKKSHRLDFMDLTKFIVGLIVIVLTAWWALAQKLSERPTHPAVQEMLMNHANGGAHPDAQEQIDEIKVEQRTIRESQIRQEFIDTAQSEALEAIKDDVKYIRRKTR